jgi:hypothetical protein
MADDEAGIHERFVFGSMWNTWALHVKIGCSLKMKQNILVKLICFSIVVRISSFYGSLLKSEAKMISSRKSKQIGLYRFRAYKRNIVPEREWVPKGTQKKDAGRCSLFLFFFYCFRVLLSNRRVHRRARFPYFSPTKSHDRRGRSVAVG